MSLCADWPTGSDFRIARDKRTIAVLSSGMAMAQGVPAAAPPPLTPALQLALNTAMLGTPEQILANLATLMANNPAAAVALAANGAARNQALAAGIAGEAAKVVPADQVVALFAAVSAAAPTQVGQIAQQVRDNAPPAALAALDTAIVEQGGQLQIVAPGAGTPPPPPPGAPTPVFVVVINESQANPVTN